MSTPFLDEVYYRVDFDRDLVFKFFTVFSLFEYAIKQSGFLTGNPGDDAKPNWHAFTQAIEAKFDRTAYPALSVAVDYMLTMPVKKQVRRKNHLIFLTRNKPNGMREVEWLSVLIRGVRNNLFHGGKFMYDRPRDPELINHSLTILEDWAQLDNDVRNNLLNVR